MKKNLALVASRFINTPLMIHPGSLHALIQTFGPRLGIDATALPPLGVEASYATDAASYDGYYQVIDGVAVIPVHGPLMKRASGFEALCGARTYLDIQRDFENAMDDASVQGIVMDVASPGGETTGCFELTDFIYSLRGKKPIYAAANDMAASAAYSIASAADKVFVTRTGAVGSVGVYALHMDQAAFDAKLGVKYTYIHAGDRKVDGNPHAPLTERAMAEFQEEVDREYEMFTNTVARNRKASLQDVIATQAGLLWADKSVPLLADEVGSFEDAMTSLLASFGRKGTKAASAAIKTRGEKAMIEPTAEVIPAVSVPVAAAPLAEETKKAANDDPECDDDTEEDDKEPTEMKNKGETTPLVPGTAAVLPPSRSMEDITAIGNLCKMAGTPEMAVEFLTKTNASGQLVSVAEISEELTNKRVAESEKTAVHSQVNPNTPHNAKATVDQLEAQARSFATQNRSNSMTKLYVEGSRKGATPQQAFAQMLEENPEAYADYRKKHNAKALVNTLRDAGFTISQAS